MLLGYLTLVMGYKIHHCDKFSLVDFTYLSPFFSIIFWIDKLHGLMKRFFPNKGCHENRKTIFFSVIIATIAKRKNASSKTWILCVHTTTESFDWISRLSWLDKYLARENVATWNVHFEKNPKIKNFIFHDYLPQFCSENRNWLNCQNCYVHFEN